MTNNTFFSFILDKYSIFLVKKKTKYFINSKIAQYEKLFKILRIFGSKNGQNFSKLQCHKWIFGLFQNLLFFDEVQSGQFVDSSLLLWWSSAGRHSIWKACLQLKTKVSEYIEDSWVCWSWVGLTTIRPPQPAPHCVSLCE